MRVISKNPDETRELASLLASKLPAGSLILLCGNLGAGKTAFVRGFLSFFGLSTQVSSPTYTILNEYENDGVLVNHLDLYRLGSVEEVEELGLIELMDSSDYTLIEWPEIGDVFYPNDAIRVQIGIGEDENTRIFDIEGADEWIK